MTGVERLVVRIMADATNYNRVFTTAETRLMSFVSMASAATISLTKVGAQMAANWQDVGVAFRVMLGDAERARGMLSDIQAFGIATPFSVEEVAKGAQLLHAYGVEANNLLPSLKAIGNVVAGTGGDMDILNRVMYNFGQVMSQNRATAVDMRQFAMAGIQIKHFAETLGVSSGEFARMVEAGEVGADAVIRTFNRLSGEGGKFFDLLQQRNEMARGQWKSLKEEFSVGLRNVGIDMLEGMRDSGLLAYMREVVRTIDVGDLRGSFQGLFSDIKGGLETVRLFMREIVEAGKDWREMLRNGGKDIDTLAEKTDVWTEMWIRIPKVFGDAFRGLRFLFFGLLVTITEIVEKITQAVNWSARQINALSEAVGGGKQFGEFTETPDFMRTLRDEFFNQMDKDRAAIDFGDAAVARWRRELAAANKEVREARNVLGEIGQIKPPWSPLPPDMMKFIESAKREFSDQGGYSNFMKKTSALMTAFYTPDPTQYPNFVGFMGKEAYELGMFRQFEDLKKSLGSMDTKFPPALFKNSAEAQDLINKNQSKGLTLQEEILKVLREAKAVEEEKLKQIKDIAKEIQVIKDMGLIKKKVP